MQEIRLTDFRSYPQADLRLAPGVTTFLGANGQGKTNLVEAVAYASTLTSHRVATDGPLVRSGADRAIVGVEVMSADRSTLIELEINPGKSNRARLNRSPARRPREVLGILQTVVFAPEDLSLVKGDPSDRRRFIDDLLIQLSPRMQGVKTDLERIVKQRNALLKSAHAARRSSLDEVERTLEVWDEQLVEVGADLVAARIGLLDTVRPQLTEAYCLLATSAEVDATTDLHVDYGSSAGRDVDTIPDRDHWRTELRQAIERRRPDELDRGITLVGPHRDDILVSLGASPAKGYASHGESWSIALSLRLAAIEVLRADGDEPVLILDDVFAELDASRRRRLTERIAGTTQVLVTAAVVDDVPVELAGRRLRVTKGAIDDE